MNVICFDITIKRNYWARVPIEDLLIKSYQQDASNSEGWTKQIESIWMNFPHKNLKAIYGASDPIAIASACSNNYYLFKPNNSTSKVTITLQLLVISNNEDINDAVNKVLKDIKRVLNCHWFKGRVARNSVKVDIKNSVYVYPFNSETNDIWDTTYKIKACFNRVIFEKGEKIQFYLILLISSSLAPSYFWSNIKDQNKDILLAIFTSGIFFCFTMLAAKIDRIFFMRHNITINNLSNFIVKGLALPFNTDTSPKFHNPIIPKNAKPEVAATKEKEGDAK
ncbi:MAG TPA: hypothetical protein DCR69_02975 [Clostridium sp.]|nr:hypothetical protein [Clostridium sp.]